MCIRDRYITRALHVPLARTYNCQVLRGARPGPLRRIIVVDTHQLFERIDATAASVRENTFAPSVGKRSVVLEKMDDNVTV